MELLFSQKLHESWIAHCITNICSSKNELNTVNRLNFLTPLIVDLRVKIMIYFESGQFSKAIVKIIGKFNIVFQVVKNYSIILGSFLKNVILTHFLVLVRLFLCENKVWVVKFVMYSFCKSIFWFQCKLLKS